MVTAPILDALCMPGDLIRGTPAIAVRGITFILLLDVFSRDVIEDWKDFESKGDKSVFLVYSCPLRLLFWFNFLKHKALFQNEFVGYTETEDIRYNWKGI